MTPATDPSPPAFEDERTEGGTPKPGPVSEHGLSWKAVAGVVSVVVTIALSTGVTLTKLDTVAETLDEVRADVRVVRLEQIEQGEWIAGAKVRLDGVEADVERLQKAPP